MPSWRLSARAQLLGFVVFIGTVWGVTYGLYPMGLARAGPVWLSALRFEAFTVAAFAFAWIIDRRLPLPRNRRDYAAVATYAILNIIIHNLATIGGSGHVPIAIVGILAGSTPLLTTAFMRLAGLRGNLTAFSGLGLLVGFAGVVVLVLGESGTLHLSVSPWALVTFGGFCSWALGSVFLKKAESDMPALSIGFWAALVSCIFLQATAFAAEPMPAWDWTLLGVVVFIGMVGGVAGFTAWMHLVRTFGPRHASTASYVSPVVASLSGVVLLDQALGWTHVVAYALIAGGLLMVAVEAAFAATGPAADGTPTARGQAPILGETPPD